MSVLPIGVESIERIHKGTNLEFNSDFSFFAPHIKHQINETLAIGGEAYVAWSKNQTIAGLFIFDGHERVGTIYTKSKEIFEYFFESAPDSYIYSELDVGQPCETFDIWAIEAKDFPTAHIFKYEVKIAEESDLQDIAKFLEEEHPYMNPKWVKIAYENGGKFFTVRIARQIAGLGWATLVNGVGRMNDVYVLRKFRNNGIAKDILHARFMWLKAHGAKWSFSEVLSSNKTMARIAEKEGLKVVGHIYEYPHESHGPLHEETMP
jgi:GNAT superfamily N-acetyltransferase